MNFVRYNITKTFVDSLPYSPSKITFYKDEKLIGFALRVTKNSKSYIAEKKLPDGRTCRVTIGAHGIWTVSQAREKAQEYLLMISKGIDPNAEKSNQKKSSINQKSINMLIPTLNTAYDNYKSKKKLSVATIEAYDRCVNDYFADWKEIKITEFSQKMVIDRHLLLSNRSLAQANLAMKFLSAVYNFTASILFDDNDEKIIKEKSPVGVIYKEKKWNKIKRRKGYIRSDQLNDWSLGVCKAWFVGNQNNNFRAYTNQDYLFTLALTGFRRSEGETLEWSNVDLKYGTIKITNTKNGEDLLLPMGDILWHIMRERKKEQLKINMFSLVKMRIVTLSINEM